MHCDYIMLQVTLKEESVRVSDSISPTDLDTVFSFYPVIQVHAASSSFYSTRDRQLFN